MRSIQRRYASGLAGAATRCGATIAEGVAVSAVNRGDDRWRVATTAGEVEASDVLFATNGYTNGAAPELKRRFVPIGSYIIATEPLEASQAHALLPRRRMAFDSKNFLYYFRVTPDRRLLFGGRAEFGRPGPDTTRRAAAILRDGMSDVFPELRGTAVEYALGRQRRVYSRSDAACRMARRRVLRRRLLRTRRRDGHIPR